MEYKNYTKKACVVRLFKPNEKLPFQVTHFDSISQAYNYLFYQAGSLNMFPATYQKSDIISLSTFRSHINNGFSKGNMKCGYFLTNHSDEFYNFTVVLE